MSSRQLLLMKICGVQHSERSLILHFLSNVFINLCININVICKQNDSTTYMLVDAVRLCSHLCLLLATVTVLGARKCQRADNFSFSSASPNCSVFIEEEVHYPQEQNVAEALRT